MLQDIRARFGRVQYREHSLLRPIERGIDPACIREAVFSQDAEVIEDYPDHPYGPCCLVLGWWDDRRPLHVLVSTTDPPWLITAWDPSNDPRNRWESDFRSRRRPPEEVE